MQTCVVEDTESGPVFGPLRITEAERCMGMHPNETKVRDAEGNSVSEQARWRAVGNAIHLGVMKHVVVSLLVCNGYITRDDVRQEGQVWTIAQDGPSGKRWGDLWERMKGGAGSRLASRAKEGRAADDAGRSDLRAVTWRDVYAQTDEKGKVVVKRLSREMGKQVVSRERGETQKDFVRQVTTDLLALSRADDTWRSYARWWRLWEEFADMYEVRPWCEGELDWKLALLQTAVTVLYLRGNYAASTIQQFATAVVTKLRNLRCGNLREFDEISAQVEGVTRALGSVVQKKDVTTDEDVCAFLRAAVPPWKGACGELRWVNLVNLVAISWSVYLRRQEITQLRLCDLTWSEGELLVRVQNTKNDKRGEGRESRLCEGEAVSGGPQLLRVIREGLLQIHHSLARHPDCCKKTDPAKRCDKCAPVFPSVTANKVHARPVPKSSIAPLLKQGYKWLEELGLSKPGRLERISVSSLRRGGNTMAAAEGIRQTVRAKHGRWKREATVTEYDGLAPGEESEVSRALQRRLTRVWKAKQQEDAERARQRGSGLREGTGKISERAIKRARKR